MKNLALRFVIGAFLSLIFSQAYSQWALTNGPYGAHTTSIVQLGSNIFAGDNGGGVFVSSDNGSTWAATNSGLTNLNITSMMANGSDLFVGTFTDLFRSNNNGATWSKVGVGLGGVRALINNAGTLYAASDGIYVSTDGGTSWNKINNSTISPLVLSLAISGSNIIAGAYDGILFSSDNGASWSKVYDSGNDSFYELAVSGSTVYAGNSNGRLLRSTDGGLTWTMVSHNFQIGISSILVVNGFIYVGTLGGGVLLSIDNGVTWNISSNGMTNFGVDALVLIGNTMYAGVQGDGVYVSTDYGSFWTLKNVGMNTSFISALGILNNKLVAGAWAGESAVSPDNGMTWTPIPDMPSVLLATSIFQVNSTQLIGGVNQLWRSTDHGASFQVSNQGINFTSFALNGNNLFAATTTSGVMRSTDEGATWTTVNSGLTNLSVSSLLVSGSNLFAGTLGGGVFISSNNGSSWSPVNSGLMSTQINALALSGNDIIAGTDGHGIFVSSDNGLNWKPVSLGLTNPYIFSLVVIGNRIFAGTFNGIYLSSTKNIYWSQEGLNDTRIYSLQVYNGDLFAATFSGIYHQSLNNFPEINSINPPDGMVGTTVTISGSNFSPTISADTVMFNGTKALITNATATSLTVVVPNGATTGPVRVAAGSQSIVSGTDFIIHVLPAPLAIAASNISEAGFTANWNVVAGATSYQLDVSTDNFTTFITNYNSSLVTGTTKIITNLVAGVAYQYRVRATNSSGGSASSNIISVTTEKSDQTITFNPLASVDYGSPSFILSATATSGLTVSYTSSNTSIATIHGDTLIILGVGNTTITASQLGNANYNAASDVPQALTVNQANQTITFNPLPITPNNQAPFPLSKYASSSSGLMVTYSSSDPSVATISGDTIKIIAIGTTTITASQAGNSNYLTATNVDQILKVEQAQTITFDSIESVPVTQAPIDLNTYASVNSGLVLNYSSSNTAVATITENILTIVGAGTSIITAEQAGDETYAPARIIQVLKVYAKALSLSGTNVVSDTLAFGKVPIGMTSTLKFIINNSGNAPLSISEIKYPVGFSGDQSSGKVEAGGTFNVNVTFTPSDVNKATGVIDFVSDATSGPGQLFVTGIGEKITGVETNSVSFSVYPNPSSGLLTIEGIDKSSNGTLSFQIVDTMGRAMENFAISAIDQNKYLLDITALNSGLYLVLTPNREAVRIIKK